jgi:putative transposase
MGTPGVGTFGLKLRVKVADRRRLLELQRSTRTNARVARRARILELLAAGQSQTQVEEWTGAGIATVGRVRRRYIEQGFDAAIFAFKAKGAPRLLGPDDEARIVALACSEPPVGRAKWTAELLAEQAIKRGVVKRIGRETVRLILKNHGTKPWLEKNVVYPSVK